MFLYLKMSEENWTKIEAMVNESNLVKYWHIHNSSSFVCTFLCIVGFLLLQVIAFIFLVVLLTTSSDNPKKAITPAEIVLAVCLPALFLLLVTSYCICKRYYYKSSSNAQQGYPNNYIKNFVIQVPYYSLFHCHNSENVILIIITTYPHFSKLSKFTSRVFE